MSALVFAAGYGVGALLSVLGMLAWIGISLRSTKLQKAHIAETERLLGERNASNARIAASTEKVAAWCEHNWESK